MWGNEILLESGTNELELMTFRLGERMFGINVAKVKTILQFDPAQLTQIPQTHAALMGMMLLRKKTVPLINLAKALHTSKPINSERPVVMVTEFNNAVNGFLVDGMDRIHRIYWQEFVPVDDLLSIHSESIIGSVHIDDDEVLVIDIERVVADIFPEQIIEEVSEASRQETAAVTRSNVRIFFAEDSKPIRETVAKSLKKLGFVNIRVFENGQKAFDALVEISKGTADAPAIPVMPHILLTDIEMPQMDGLTLCKKVKEELGLQKIVIVMFSSLINPQMISKCQEVGATDYIAKPEINTLVAKLDAICQQQPQKKKGDP
jgi:two-component system chemotaxis response regulator CheV